MFCEKQLLKQMTFSPKNWQVQRTEFCWQIYFSPRQMKMNSLEKCYLKRALKPYSRQQCIYFFYLAVINKSSLSYQTRLTQMRVQFRPFSWLIRELFSGNNHNIVYHSKTIVFLEKVIWQKTRWILFFHGILIKIRNLQPRIMFFEVNKCAKFVKVSCLTRHIWW